MWILFGLFGGSHLQKVYLHEKHLHKVLLKSCSSFARRSPMPVRAGHICNISKNIIYYIIICPTGEIAIAICYIVILSRSLIYHTIVILYTITLYYHNILYRRDRSRPRVWRGVRAGCDIRTHAHVPKTACRTSLYDEMAQLEVRRSFSGRGMGMKITAQCGRRDRVG